MSGPEIPNLLSSLRSARGGRGRGRGRGSHASSSATHDSTIQGTDTDASVSRLSAVDLGYLDDPYAQYFVQSSAGPAARRLPIINRGTYARTISLDNLIESFLSADQSTGSDSTPKQIVSLGAGTDTRPFRLFASKARPGLVYHELDFEVVTSKKLRTVQAVPALRNILTNVTQLTEHSWSSKPLGVNTIAMAKTCVTFLYQKLQKRIMILKKHLKRNQRSLSPAFVPISPRCSCRNAASAISTALKPQTCSTSSHPAYRTSQPLSTSLSGQMTHLAR
ncbi:hypothetical protein NXS19_008656 [Fusarium pseudograminearum]|nr:hypothetical protein NXS19_008656 [Fusarium pseudograminearum]